MTLIIAVLMALGLISSPEEANTQVISDNEVQIHAVIGDDYEAF